MFKYFNPINYFNKIRALYHGYFYDLKKIRSDERRKFEKLNFDFDEGLMKLNNILSQSGMNAFSSMSSVHTLLFSCLSLVSKIEDILEIGTYKGESALLMSKIFPDAKIMTFDLPDNDPILAASYKRESAVEMRKYKEQQKRNIKSQNITFIEKNSFFIPGEVLKKFDLIWIDGGHLYPEVAWDICNAYHLCKQGGWIMCDDIVIDKKGQKNDYVSGDSYEVLEYIRARTGEEITYFLKKDHPLRAANPRERKYVAVLKKK